jgi:hypothetical protein
LKRFLLFHFLQFFCVINSPDFSGLIFRMSPALKTRLSYPLVVSASLLSSGTISSAHSCELLFIFKVFWKDSLPVNDV